MSSVDPATSLATAPLSNLTTALSRLVRPVYEMGMYNSDSVYYQAYQHVADTSHPASHHFITSPKVTHTSRRLALKYRGGGIYTAKLAHRYGRSDTTACPLCGQPDSQSHLLGGCSHAEMKSLYIARHHAATRAILLALCRGEQGGHVIQADVGTSTALSAVLQRVPNTVPRTVARAPPRSAPLPRPDITTRHGTYVTYLDVKYGPDTRLHDKEQPSKAHYDRLVRHTHTHLRPSVRILLLGVGGRIPLDLITKLGQLGISASRLNTLCNCLNRQAVQWMRTIVGARRRLEPD